MRRYGKRLMSAYPDQTAKMLTALCSDWVPTGITKSLCKIYTQYSIVTLVLTTAQQVERADPADFIGIFVNNKQQLMRFLEHQIKVHVKLRDVVYNTLLELYLNEIGTCQASERVTKETRALELLKRSEVSHLYVLLIN